MVFIRRYKPKCIPQQKIFSGKRTIYPLYRHEQPDSSEPLPAPEAQAEAEAQAEEGVYETDRVPNKATVQDFDLFCIVTSIFTFAIDVCTDYAVAFAHFYNGRHVEGGLVLFFTVVPSILMNLLTYYWASLDKSKAMREAIEENDQYPRQQFKELRLVVAMRFTMILCIFQLGPIFWYYKAYFYGVCFQHHGRSKQMRRKYFLRMAEAERDASILRLIEAFFESAPQLIIQGTVFINYFWTRKLDNEPMTGPYPGWVFLQFVSLISSGFSVSWTIIVHARCVRMVREDKLNIFPQEAAVMAVWRFFTIASRVTVICFAILIYRDAFSVIFMVHYIVSFLHITLLQFISASPPTSIVLMSLNAFIHTFTPFNMAEGRTRWRYVVAYGIELYETYLLELYNPTHFFSFIERRYVEAGIQICYGIGLLAMVVYYWFLHPSKRRDRDVIIAALKSEKADFRKPAMQKQLCKDAGCRIHRRCVHHIRHVMRLEALRKRKLEEQRLREAISDPTGIIKRAMIESKAEYARQKAKQDELRRAKAREERAARGEPEPDEPELEVEQPKPKPQPMKARTIADSIRELLMKRTADDENALLTDGVKGGKKGSSKSGDVEMKPLLPRELLPPALLPLEDQTPAQREARAQFFAKVRPLGHLYPSVATGSSKSAQAPLAAKEEKSKKKPFTPHPDAFNQRPLLPLATAQAIRKLEEARRKEAAEEEAELPYDFYTRFGYCFFPERDPEKVREEAASKDGDEKPWDLQEFLRTNPSAPRDNGIQIGDTYYPIYEYKVPNKPNEWSMTAESTRMHYFIKVATYMMKEFFEKRDEENRERAKQGLPPIVNEEYERDKKLAEVRARREWQMRTKTVATNTPTCVIRIDDDNETTNEVASKGIVAVPRREIISRPGMPPQSVYLQTGDYIWQGFPGTELKALPNPELDRMKAEMEEMKNKFTSVKSFYEKRVWKLKLTAEREELRTPRKGELFVTDLLEKHVSRVVVMPYELQRCLYCNPARRVYFFIPARERPPRLVSSDYVNPDYVKWLDEFKRKLAEKRITEETEAKTATSNKDNIAAEDLKMTSVKNITKKKKMGRRTIRKVKIRWSNKNETTRSDAGNSMRPPSKKKEALNGIRSAVQISNKGEMLKNSTWRTTTVTEGVLVKKNDYAEIKQVLRRKSIEEFIARRKTEEERMARLLGAIDKAKTKKVQKPGCHTRNNTPEPEEQSAMKEEFDERIKKAERKQRIMRKTNAVLALKKRAEMWKDVRYTNFLNAKMSNQRRYRFFPNPTRGKDGSITVKLAPKGLKKQSLRRNEIPTNAEIKLGGSLANPRTSRSAFKPPVPPRPPCLQPSTLRKEPVTPDQLPTMQKPPILPKPTMYKCATKIRMDGTRVEPTPSNDPQLTSVLSEKYVEYPSNRDAIRDIPGPSEDGYFLPIKNNQPSLEMEADMQCPSSTGFIPETKPQQFEPRVETRINMLGPSTSSKSTPPTRKIAPRLETRIRMPEPSKHDKCQENTKKAKSSYGLKTNVGGNVKMPEASQNVAATLNDSNIALNLETRTTIPGRSKLCKEHKRTNDVFSQNDVAGKTKTPRSSKTELLTSSFLKENKTLICSLKAIPNMSADAENAENLNARKRKIATELIAKYKSFMARQRKEKSNKSTAFVGPMTRVTAGLPKPSHRVPGRQDPSRQKPGQQVPSQKKLSRQLPNRQVPDQEKAVNRVPAQQEGLATRVQAPANYSSSAPGASEQQPSTIRHLIESQGSSLPPTEKHASHAKRTRPIRQVFEAPDASTLDEEADIFGSFLPPASTSWLQSASRIAADAPSQKPSSIEVPPPPVPDTTSTVVDEEEDMIHIISPLYHKK